MDPFSPNSPPIQDATHHWTEFPVLYSRSLLVTHFKYSSAVYHLFHIIRIDLFHHPVLPDVASTVPGCGDLGKASHVTRACSVTSDSL